MFTTDPIYLMPYKPKITILSLDKTTNFYTFNPWTDTGVVTKPIYCNVQLSQNHQGVFTVQIEDENGVLSSNIDLNVRVIIECGKYSTGMYRLISGLVRQTGFNRGSDDTRLYTLTGSSTGIRFNERVLYFSREAAKLAQDGISLDITDPNMKADVLLESGLSGLAAGSGYPGNEAVNVTNIAANSDVENFIPSLTVELGELQAIINNVEEQSDGEVFVDINDQTWLRHQFQNPIAGKGFTITNKKGTADNADDTMYLTGKNWELTESMLKSDNYSNINYGVLASETLDTGAFVNPVPDYIGIGNAAQETAQKFRPTHGRWLVGDVAVAGYSHAGAVSARQTPIYRICGPDVANTPANLPVIVNLLFGYDDSPLDPNTTGFNEIRRDIAILDTSLANISNQSYALDITKDYWLLFSHYSSGTSGATTTQSNQYCVWDFRAMSGGTGLWYRFTGTGSSTPSNSGTGWATGSPFSGYLMWFAMPRFRSIAFQCADPKAIKVMSGGTTRAGVVESTITSIPSYIKTKEAMYSYLTGLMYFMARPRVNYSMAKVSAPNIPIMPGDPIMISDNILGYSSTGTQAVMAVCGDMTYTWGTKNGSGLTYQKPTYLNIQPVGNVTRYR